MVYRKPLGFLTLSWWRFLSYRNQFIDLLSKSMDWFLYDMNLHHGRFNQVLPKMSHATRLKFSSTIIQSFSYFIRETRIKRNKSQLFRETTWVIATVCHWSTCKCNNMQTWFPCFFGIDHVHITLLHGYLLVRDDWQRGSFLGGILWGQEFFSFSKHFSLSLILTWLWPDTFIFIGKHIFQQQSKARKISTFSVPHAQPWCVLANLKLVNFYRNFSWYNIENLIRTLVFLAWQLGEMNLVMVLLRVLKLVSNVMLVVNTIYGKNKVCL